MKTDKEMMDEFNNGFEKANRVSHPVETQWHYTLMSKHGFVCQDGPQKGFVRSYTYHHSDGTKVTVTTGSRADYWESSDKAGGYWSDLKPYLERRFPIG